MLRRIAIAQVLAVAFLGAQDQPRLISLNVVAVDSQGQPVTDLTQAEFQVVDDGKRQQPVFFRHLDSKLAQAPTLGPGEFSNTARTNAPHVTLILFDLLNERFDTRALTANQIVEQLGDIENGDDLYLYLLTLDGRLFSVHGLNAAETGSPQDGPWTRRIKPLLDQALRAVQTIRPIDSADVNVRIGLTFQALQEIAAPLAAFPGRKNIVWVTDGVPISLGSRSSYTGEPVDFTPQLRQLSEWFDRSGVAIYPVREVMLGSSDGMGGSGDGSLEFLNTLSGLTGGRPSASKDVGMAVKQAMRDLRSSYQIGYFPPEKNWNNKFHNLRVTCTRKGVRVQARTGYYAWQEAAGARADRAIGAAVTGQFDAAEIGLRGTLERDPNNARQAKLAVRIAANDVTLVQSGGQYVGQLRVACVQYREDGRATGSAIMPLDLSYDAAARDRALKEGIPFQQSVTLEDGVSRVRFIVFDRDSDMIGSLSMPVK
jgi:VWFA-related protein